MRRFPTSWDETRTKLGFEKRISRAKRNQRRRRLGRPEALEPRTMLSANPWEFRVTTDFDEDNGSADGSRSLREALDEASQYSGPETPVVLFAPALAGETILLGDTDGDGEVDDTTLGELTIGSSVEIVGPGADLLTVSGGRDGQGGGSRVFRLQDSAQLDVTIRGLTIADGDAGSGDGGGVYSKPATAGDHTLTLDSVVLTGNHADDGGAVFAQNAAVTIRDSTLDDNQAGFGGAIRFVPTTISASLDLLGSTVSNNRAVGSGSFVGNSSGLSVYGYSSNQSDIRIENSTFSGNNSAQGGAIQVTAAASGSGINVEIVNSTIAENTADNAGFSAGITNPNSATVTVHNSIVAHNDTGGTTLDATGALAGTHNLIGDFHSSTGIDGSTPGTLLISQALDGTAGLLPLGDYGGPTKTYALRPNSIAIDAGDGSLAAGVLTDQRGLNRIVDGGSPLDGIRTIDIGAYERELVVDTHHDVVNAGDGLLSLREALTEAAANPGLDTITFAPALAGETILLGDTDGDGEVDDTTLGELTIGSSVEIVGPGADLLTVSGGRDGQGGGSRVFRLQDSAQLDVTIRGLTIADGDAGSGDGGGVYSKPATAGDHTLTLDSVVLTGNHADDGGAVFAQNAAVTIRDSTLDDNQAGFGGAIRFVPTTISASLDLLGSTVSNNRAVGSGSFVGNSSGLSVYGYSSNQSDIRIENSTFSGNNSAQGGAIQVTAAASGSGINVEIVNSTIAENTADNAGFSAGITNPNSATVTVHNSIVAHNDTGGTTLDATGALAGTHNLIGDFHSSTGIDGSTPGTLLISQALDGTAGLLPLGDYGGPTKTYALRPNSIAIDAGDGSLIDPVFRDQRGRLFYRELGTSVDIGSVESQIIEDSSSPGVFDAYGTRGSDWIQIGRSILFIGAIGDDEEVELFSLIDLAENSTPSSLTVAGLAGDDQIDEIIIAAGQPIPSIIFLGGDGDDRLTRTISLATSVTLDGGPGDDHLKVLPPVSAPTTLIGGTGSDLLEGSAGGSETFADIDADGSTDDFFPVPGSGIDSLQAPSITVNGTDPPVETLTLDVDRNGLVGDVTIDWGDGSSWTVVPASESQATHTYLIGGLYDVQVWITTAGSDRVFGSALSQAVLANAASPPVIESVLESGNVNLRWDSYTVNPDSQLIQRSRSGLDGTWEEIFEVLPSNPVQDRKFYPDADQTYYYRVGAVKDGQTAWSEPRHSTRSVDLQLSVDSTVTVHGGSASVELTWFSEHFINTAPDPIDYAIYRKLPSDDAWPISPIARVSSISYPTGWIDDSVQLGTLYDYRIDRVSTGSGVGINDTAYLSVPVEVDAARHEQHGSIVLLVDDRFSSSLAMEIARLESDLIGDGWSVIRQDLNVADPALTPSLIKSQHILPHYNSLSGTPSEVRSVLLIGAIPVPETGWFTPDGHEKRSAAADVYYGDVDDHLWTDTVVNETSAIPTGPRNVPGDGRFDQNSIPDDGDSSPLEVSVGRIDMSNMAVTDPNSEYDGAGAWQSYSIDVGSAFENQIRHLQAGSVGFDYMTLIVGDTQSGQSAGASHPFTGYFRNIKIHDTATGVTTEINDTSNLSYVQTRAGNSTNLNRAFASDTFDPSWQTGGGGVAELAVSTSGANGSEWGAIGWNDGSKFVVTATSVLTFEFRTDQLPGFVGIGFDHIDQQDNSSLTREYIQEDHTFRIHALDTTGFRRPWGRAIDVAHETNLMRQYFDKDHDFRHGVFDVSNAALHDGSDEVSRGNAYSVVGRLNTRAQWDEENDWLRLTEDSWQPVDPTDPAPELDSYLFGLGSSTGSAWASNGLQSIVALDDGVSRTVFNRLRHSYVHHYDYADSLVRSLLADEGYGLTSYPIINDYSLHDLGSGATIGDTQLRTANDGSDLEGGVSSSQRTVTVNLLGDPTLRAHVLDAPTDVEVFEGGGPGVTTVEWAFSAEDTNFGGATDAGYSGDFLGYYIYSAPDWDSPFVRVSNPATDDLFDGNQGATVSGNPSDIWMVRAARRETSGNGAYINLSQGAFSEVFTGSGGGASSGGGSSSAQAISTLPNEAVAADAESGTGETTPLSTEAPISISTGAQALLIADAAFGPVEDGEHDGETLLIDSPDSDATLESLEDAFAEEFGLLS